MKKGNYYSIGQVAQMIGVVNDTITRWYSWYEDDSYTKPQGLVLPKYVYLDKRKVKYFHKDDIELLKQFASDLKTKYRGCMAEYNQKHFWGNREIKIVGKQFKEENENEQSRISTGV